MSATVSAQTELDTTFNSSGFQAHPFNGAAGGNDLAVQADNKIVMVGFCRPVSTVFQCVARYNENGSLDTSFGGEGYVVTDVATARWGVALQSDGKIVAVGYVTVSPTSETIAITRFNTNGTLDSTFGSGGKVLANIGLYGLTRGTAVAIQPDGKILISGTSAPFQTFPPVPLGYQGVVARYLNNGTLDSSFGNGGIFRLEMSDATKAQSLALQADGKVLIGGYRDSSNGSLSPASLLVRLNPNGTLDTSWDTDGYALGTASASGPNLFSVAVPANGRVVAVAEGNAVYRFNADGSPDTSFDGDGVRQTALESAVPYKVLAAVGDRIIVVGTGPGNPFAISRFLSDGSLDNSFSDDGRLAINLPLGYVTGAAVAGGLDSLGRLVIGGAVGTAQSSKFALFRLLAPAVSVGISGRVTRPGGRPVVNAILATDVGGGTIVSAVTNQFGNYHFVNVVTGRSYTISVKAKRFTFTDRSVSVGDQVANFDFVAEP
jgi:uncharacterized delta-60 repeat protein